MTLIKKQAVIIDIDGTLANCDRRREAASVNPNYFDWKTFNEGMVFDNINMWCAGLVEVLFNAGVKIIFVTGREEVYREVTLNWLYNYGMQDYSDLLFMRPEKNYGKDCDIKKEIYLKQIESFYNILFCVDDRKQVVDMWRSLGLVCLQCAEGNF